jgi:hypothetical protein
VLPVRSRILVVEMNEVPDIEGDEAALFLDGKVELLAVRFAFALQILSVNDVISPLLQGVEEAGVDILIQE